MGKKPFTTRLDEEVLEVAQKLAAFERRSVTSLIEIAVLDYAERHRLRTSPGAESSVQILGPQDEAAAGAPEDEGLAHGVRPVRVAAR